jgi:hypothetical protein
MPCAMATSATYDAGSVSRTEGGAPREFTSPGLGHNADIRVGTGACHRPNSTERAPNRIISTITIGQSLRKCLCLGLSSCVTEWKTTFLALFMVGFLGRTWSYARHQQKQLKGARRPARYCVRLKSEISFLPTRAAKTGTEVDAGLLGSVMTAPLKKGHYLNSRMIVCDQSSDGLDVDQEQRKSLARVLGPALTALVSWADNVRASR